MFPLNLSRLADQLGALLADPTSNITATVLLLALLGLVALILIVLIILVFFVLPGRGEEEDEDELEDEDEGEGAGEDGGARDLEDADTASLGGAAESETGESADSGESDVSRTRRGLPIPPVWLLTLVTVGFVAAASVFAFGYTSRTTFCTDSCHHAALDGYAKVRDSHARVACVKCHEEPGAAGVAASSLWRASHVVTGLLRARTESAPVASRRCLRCHDAAIAGTVRNETSGVSMSHKEVLAAGMACQDCHRAVGHKTETRPGMAVCLRCHGAGAATAECSTCHRGDPSSASTVVRYFPRIVAAKRDCGGCHNQRKCDACHGMRMPHSQRFVLWEHAKTAAFSGKQKCVKCHPALTDCGRCHDNFLSAHNGGKPETAVSHSRFWDKKMMFEPVVQCSCHNTYNYKNFCAICHEEAGKPFYPGQTPGGD